MTHSLRWRLFPGLLLCAGLVLPAASAGPQKEQQPKLLLEEAGKKELVDGDLKGAIATYERILNVQGVPRALTARPGRRTRRWNSWRSVTFMPADS